MTEEKAKSLIGRKVLGFEFQANFSNDLPYSISMDKHINEIGLITDYYSNMFKVEFKDDWWHYPASLIEAHLVEEDWELKIEDLETDTSEIEQLKADKEALVIALKDFISAIDSDKVILASEYEQAKQTLAKHGK